MIGGKETGGDGDEGREKREEEKERRGGEERIHTCADSEQSLKKEGSGGCFKL